MYARILLAYDGSREGRAALREGALLAKRFGAEVFLLSVVVESQGVRIGEAAYAGAIVQSHDAYRALFDEAMGRLVELGLGADGRFATGDPTEEIAAYAAAVKADLVVVGHRRQGVLERWWQGATGAYLSDHLSCSLLISRNQVSDAEFLEAFPSATLKAPT